VHVPLQSQVTHGAQLTDRLCPGRVPTLPAGKAAGMRVCVTKSIYSEDEDFSSADVVFDCIGGGVSVSVSAPHGSSSNGGVSHVLCAGSQPSTLQYRAWKPSSKVICGYQRNSVGASQSVLRIGEENDERFSFQDLTTPGAFWQGDDGTTE